MEPGKGPEKEKAKRPRPSQSNGSNLFQKLGVAAKIPSPNGATHTQPKGTKRTDFSNAIVESIRREKDESASFSKLPPKRTSFASPAQQRPEILPNQVHFTIKRLNDMEAPSAKRRKISDPTESDKDGSFADPVTDLKISRESTLPSPDLSGCYAIPISSLADFASFCVGKQSGGGKAREIYQFHDWIVGGVVSATTPIYRAGAFDCAFSFRIHNLNAISVAAIIFGDEQQLETLSKSLKPKCVAHLLNPTITQSKDKSGFFLRLQSSEQVHIAGESVQFGTCQEVINEKRKKICGNVVNLARGDKCAYHLDRVLVSFSSTRMELNATGSVAPSLKEKSELKYTDATNDLSRGIFELGQNFSLVVEKQGRGGLREVAADVQKRDPTKNALVDKDSDLVDKFKSGGAIGGQSTKSTGARQVRQLVLATEEGSVAAETPEERLKMLKRTKGNDLAGATLHPYSVQMYLDGVGKGKSGVDREDDANDLSLEIESDEEVDRKSDRKLEPPPSRASVAFHCLEVRFEVARTTASFPGVNMLSQPSAV